MYIYILYNVIYTHLSNCASGLQDKAQMTSESSFLAGRGIPDMLLQLVLCELVKHQSELCFRVLLVYFSLFLPFTHTAC